jgi:hypothetical protein
MASNLTRQDHHILEVLGWHLARTASGIAALASLEMQSSSKTAARHLTKLTTLGLAEQTGTRLFPTWVITDRGRLALAERNGGDGGQQADGSPARHDDAEQLAHSHREP